MNSIGWMVSCALLAATGAVQAAKSPTSATSQQAAGKPPAVVEGLVTQVPLGDSLWFTPTDKPAVLLQLTDVDAPEPCQVYGEESRRALTELALNRRATARMQGRDPQGRMLARVNIDGLDLSQRMVEEGHVWSTRTKWDRGPLVKEERMARALNRGLHAAAKPMMPKDFRQLHGPCSAPAALPAPLKSAPPVAPAPPAPR